MSESSKILLVEDEPHLAKGLQFNLKREGYEVFLVDNGVSALDQLREKDFDLIILDLMLPKMSGLEVARTIRETNIRFPILMLTAKSSKKDKEVGLEAGADDYLTKPFFLPELNARLKSVIRRLNLEINHEVIVNEISLFPEQMRALINGKELDLTAKEFDLLLYFLSNQNRVISKTTLGEYMSSNYADYGFTDDMVYTHIKNLKKKLNSSNCTDYIKNVYGVGYKFLVS